MAIFRSIRFLIAGCAAVSVTMSGAQTYDTPGARLEREQKKLADDLAKKNERPKEPSLEQKKSEAMEYLGRIFKFTPNPTAFNRISFYDRIPLSSRSQDPKVLFTPVVVTNFVVRGVFMPPPAIYPLGTDEYLLEIEFLDGKIGYVNLVGNFGIKSHELGGELDARAEYVEFLGISPKTDEIIALEKARQERQVQAERRAIEQTERDLRTGQEKADRDARQAREKAEAKRKSDLAERKLQDAKPLPHIGMTSKEVVNLTKWGRPYDVNRTTTGQGVREQWVYSNRRFLYFENGILTAIQD